MKKFIVFLLLTIQLIAAPSMKSLENELNNLDINQIKVLLKTFKKGKLFDYEYTLMAIAWQESKFGKYSVNLSDPSFGVFNTLLTSAINRSVKTDTEWNRSRLAERLIIDFDFSFSQAIAELKYWENYWKSKKVSNVWKRTVASFNAGFNWKNGLEYEILIKKRIKVLKKYVNLHKELFKQI